MAFVLLCTINPFVESKLISEQHIAGVLSPFGAIQAINIFLRDSVVKCFVQFELKTSELVHQDIGQMDMYVRRYDELKRGPDDNPTVGIILCSQKDASVVRFSVLNDSEQLFASRYKLVLPTEEELRRELERERAALLEFGQE